MTEHDATGIRATHCVTFQPEEITAIRAAARDAGVTVTRWLHDLAVTKAAPVTVEINFGSTVWTAEQTDQFIREFARRARQEPPKQF